jgi:hypothetical protein
MLCTSAGWQLMAFPSGSGSALARFPSRTPLQDGRGRGAPVHEIGSDGALKFRRAVPISMVLFDRAGDFAKDAATQLRLRARSLEGFEFDSGSSPAAQVAPCTAFGPKLQGDYFVVAAA